jgi:hypothetical protein
LCILYPQLFAHIDNKTFGFFPPDYTYYPI